MGGMLQRVCGRGVGTKFRIEVTKDSDANGVTHVVIVLERLGTVAGSRLEAWCREGARELGYSILLAAGLRQMEA
jgi:hypothetical protein